MRRIAPRAIATAALASCPALAGCATELRIPRPVPLPVHEHVVAAPQGAAWEASQAALQNLDFVPADVEEAQGSIVTGFRPLAGNTPAHRTAGVARLVVERDEYAAGRARLLLQVIAEEADRTRVRVAAQLQAQVTGRGEIQYAEAGRGRSPLPLFTAWTRAQAEAQPDGWEGLTSNGVLEDEFLAALADELSRKRGAAQ